MTTTPPVPQLPDYPNPMHAAPGSRPGASVEIEGLIFVPNDGTAWSICIGGVWYTVPTGTGTLTEITSTDLSVTVTNPFGPIVDLSVSGGGGGGFTIMDQETDGNSETIPADASPHNLSWVYATGTAVLDTSSPTAPVVLADGWYGFNLQLTLDAGDAPGQFGAFILTIFDGSVPQYVLLAEQNEDLTFGPGSLFGMSIQTPLLYVKTTYTITAQFAINALPDLLVDTTFRTYHYH